MTAFILAVIVNNYNTGQVSVTAPSHPHGLLCAGRGGGGGAGWRSCRSECPGISHPQRAGWPEHTAPGRPSGWALPLSSHRGVI